MRVRIAVRQDFVPAARLLISYSVFFSRSRFQLSAAEPHMKPAEDSAFRDFQQNIRIISTAKSRRKCLVNIIHCDGVRCRSGDTTMVREGRVAVELESEFPEYRQYPSYACCSELRSPPTEIRTAP